MKLLAISDMHSNLQKWIESKGTSSGLPALTMFPKAMVERGHEYHWLVVESSRFDWEKHHHEASAYKLYKYDSSAVIMPESSNYRYELIHGIHVHRVSLPNQKIFRLLLVPPLKYLKIYGIFYFIFGLQIAIRFITKIKPNIIYGQSYLISPLAAYIKGVPCVIRLYGTFLHPFLYPVYKRLSKIGEFMVFMVPSSGYIITNDGTRGNEVAAAMGINESKVHFWTNGIKKEWTNLKIDSFEIKNSLGINKYSPVILTVSRLESWKRVDRIIASMPYVLAHVPETQLVIVGDGTQRKSLEKLVEKLGIQKNVIFAGSVLHDDIWRYMYASDLFVSVFELSNLSNSVLEAMACGKCVVTLADGSLNNIIESGKTGVLVSPKEIDKNLPASLVELLTDQPYRLKLGAQAQEYAIHHFKSWDDRLEEECTLIERLAKKDSYS